MDERRVMSGYTTARDSRAKARLLAAVWLAGLVIGLPHFPVDRAAAANPFNPVEDPFAYLRRLLPSLCVAARDNLDSLSAKHPDFRFLGSDFGTDEAPPMRYDWRADYPWGSVRVTAMAPHRKLRRFTVEIWHNGKPQVMGLAGPVCRLGSGRQILYSETGKPESLAIYSSGFWRLISVEPFDAPVPPGEGHDGLRVGLIDTGVAYDQPFIAKHLARRSDGSLVGYDYWDEDPRPYDLHGGHSLFLPRRHGTLVASLLISEAPNVALVPYRFPNRDTTRLAALVEAAARDNVPIIAMPVGSTQKKTWLAFEAAARAHPDILFIMSAGNYGRDIDREAVYPASFGLANALVVTSSQWNGQLGEGSNWGAKSVDLMVPADRLMARDAQGKEREVGGTSMAASRVAALAARLAIANPDWRAAELKAAILAHAEPLPAGSGAWVRYGWIPKPDAIAPAR